MRAGSDRRSGRARPLWRRGGVLVFGALLALLPVGTARADITREYAGTLAFTVNGITPIAVTSDSGNQIAIRGSVTNTGKQTVDDLQFIAQRGDALSGVTAVRNELAHPSEPEAVITQKWQDFASALAPGASEPFTVTIGVVGDTLDTLAVEQRGVYPLMFNINGDLVDPSGGDSFHARVGELHTVLTVLSLPTTPATTLDPEAGPTVTPTAFAEIWPVVDRPHLGVNGIFDDDDLTPVISAGGRLTAVLDALQASDPGPDTVTLEIDPELLDELDQMADGYRVLAAGQQPAALTPTTVTVTPSGSTTSPSPSAGASGPSRGRGDGGRPNGTASPTVRSAALPGAPVPSAAGTSTLPTSTGTSGAAQPAGPETVAGRGSGAAAAFLDRLRQAVRRHRVLLLPYGDPDVVAMTRMGLTDLVSSLTDRGRTVAARVLPDLRTEVTADPYQQQADPATLAALAAAGYRSTVLAATSVQPTGSALGAAVVTTGDHQTLAAALTDADVLADLRSAAAAGTAPDRMHTQTALAALAAAAAFTGGGTPVVLAYDRHWTPGLAPAVVAPLLRVLTGAGIWRGQDVDQIAAGGTVSISASATPTPGSPPPLAPDYLGRVAQDRQWVARLRDALVATEPTGSTRVDPAAQLDPLDEALARTLATSLRSDPSTADQILGTVEDTVADLRQGVAIRSGSHLTLASASSPLLVTVQNTLPYAVKIRLVIRGGESVGLQVTQPELQEIPAGRTVPIRVPTQVSRSGTFAVTADLVGPDGTSWSDSTRLTVSSSAYGAVTVIVVIVAGVVLLLMVIWRISQRIRGRGRPDADEATP